MSLPARQQRVLDLIESALRHREPRLTSMFTMFTRLNVGEGAPRTERLEPSPWWAWRRSGKSRRRRRSAAALPMLLLVPLAAMVVAAIFLGMSASRVPCLSAAGTHGLMTRQSHPRNCTAASGFQGFSHIP